jgi:hypothetical protein
MNHYPILEKWQEFYSAAMVELPVAAAQMLFNGGRRRDAEAAAWRAYESWLWLANETANRFYNNGAALRIERRTGNLRLVSTAPPVESILDSWPHAGRIEAR